MFLASGKWTPHFRIFSLELLQGPADKKTKTEKETLKQFCK